jgi:hypothetical protein
MSATTDTINNGLRRVFSTNDICDGLVDSTQLIGPLCLFPGDSDRNWALPRRIWDALPPFLPVVACVHAGHFDTAQNHKLAPLPFGNLVSNVIDLSSNYGGHGIIVKEALRKEAVDPKNKNADHHPLLQSLIDLEKSSHEQNTSEKYTRVWTSVHPFHVDRSKGVQYYSEMEVDPPRARASVAIPVSGQDSGSVWTVKLGDIVALKCRDCCGSATYFFDPNFNNQIKSSNYKYSPFKDPWAVGQIVSIMRPCTDSNEICPDLDFVDCGIQLEIRWFYREREWPGHVKPTEKESELDCEELLESSLYDEIAADAILAPVSVYESARPVTFCKHFMGMPELEFHSNRYWSTQRKSLVRINGAAGRIARSRALSKRIRNDASLKTSIARISSPTDSGDEPVFLDSGISWADAFTSVIHKLSLTDASKEAYDNAALLIGREQEKQEIMSFLRNSIQGKSIDNTKGSMFVAGPPGVGKTAVRIGEV